MVRSKLPERPNILWVFGDQHRAQALSCAGDPNVDTPNLDLLGVNGLRFTNAVAGMPLCCPFRGSLITSRYPHECVPGHEYPLPADQKTVAHAFRDAGYHTAWFGKWHLGGFHERNGRAALAPVAKELRGGFDQWLGYDNNNAQWDCWVHGHDTQGNQIEHYRLPGFETDCLTDLLIDYFRGRASLKQEAAEPFFAALSVQPPHNPYQAPEEFMRGHNPARLELRPNVPPIPRVEETARRDLAGYYAQIENLDWNFGRIVEALRETGLWDNTLVLFFSDHGDMHGSHGQGKKMTPYEESLKIPFIIGGGASRYSHACGTSDVPVNHVDIAPTSLGLANIDVPEWMNGTDCSSFFSSPQGDTPEMDSAYLQSVIPTKHGDSIDVPWRGIMTRDGWKYVCFEHNVFMMFDLNEDPFELNNMAHNSKYRGKRRELHERLQKWIDHTKDDFTLPELPV